MLRAKTRVNKPQQTAGATSSPPAPSPLSPGRDAQEHRDAWEPTAGTLATLAYPPQTLHSLESQQSPQLPAIPVNRRDPSGNRQILCPRNKSPEEERGRQARQPQPRHRQRSCSSTELPPGEGGTDGTEGVCCIIQTSGWHAQKRQLGDVEQFRRRLAGTSHMD